MKRPKKPLVQTDLFASAPPPPLAKANSLVAPPAAPSRVEEASPTIVPEAAVALETDAATPKRDVPRALATSAPQGNGTRAHSVPAAGATEPAPALGSPAVAPRAVDNKPKVLTVGDLTRQIKGTLERSFTRVLVRGEVSGFRGANPRGHLYFSLKDADASIDTKIWASSAARMKFKLRDGMAVVIEGHIDLYEPQGRYSLIVSKIDPEGEGALALAFQQLKERLSAEGLMGDKRVRPPRPIPFLARRIGVVTSRTGAALQDFLRVLHARHPRMSVLVADARVQGEGSAYEVVRAIERLSRTDVDVIVVTRGGGSMEDLWTFNEEIVARAIFKCPVPVVSAIGHEIDFTIADFVADLRAPTPSAAAERLAPVLSDLELSLATWKSRLRKAVERKLLVDKGRAQLLRQQLVDPRRLLDGRRLQLSEHAEALAAAQRRAVRTRQEQLRALSERLSRQRPEAKLAQNRAALQQLKDRLERAMARALSVRAERFRRSRIGIERQNPLQRLQKEHGRLARSNAQLHSSIKALLTRRHHQVDSAARKLDALSPLRVMRRGYAVAFKDNHVVRRANQVAVGDELTLRVLPPDAEDHATPDALEEISATVSRVGKRGPG